MVTKNNSANLNFSLLGAAGYIAPRHLEAIKAVGGELIAAADPSDSVGILDRYFPHAQFFVSFERFEHFVNKQRETEKPIDFISICSPNYLHDTHCRFALQNAAHAICEKPLVLLPSNLERLRRSEAASSKRIFCILQLRHHPKIIDLKNRVAANPEKRFRVNLTYITSRGPWYDISWKGDSNKSGGILFNIGIHFFDMLLYIFGPESSSQLLHSSQTSASGKLVCEQADIRWNLSTDSAHLPENSKKSTFREITIDGETLEFSDGFTDLHTQSYQAILDGKGFGLDDVAPSLALVTNLKQS